MNRSTRDEYIIRKFGLTAKEFQLIGAIRGFINDEITPIFAQAATDHSQDANCEFPEFYAEGGDLAKRIAAASRILVELGPNIRMPGGGAVSSEADHIKLLAHMSGINPKELESIYAQAVQSLSDPMERALMTALLQPEKIEIIDREPAGDEEKPEAGESGGNQ